MNFYRVFRRAPGCSALLIVLVLNGARMADAEPAGDALARLRSPDIRVRRKAIDEIQTLDDRRTSHSLPRPEEVSARGCVPD